jgi:hypothetical protein
MVSMGTPCEICEKSTLPVGVPEPKASSAAVKKKSVPVTYPLRAVVVRFFPVTVTVVALDVLFKSLVVPPNTAVILFAPSENEAVFRFAVPCGYAPDEPLTICAEPSNRVPS